MMKFFAIVGIASCACIVFLAIYVLIVILKPSKKTTKKSEYDMWNGNESRADYFVTVLQKATLLSEADLTKVREEIRLLSCEDFTSEYGQQLYEYKESKFTMNEYLKEALLYATKAKKIISKEKNNETA